MNCPVCGTDNREGARFCRRCGEELAEAAVSETPAAMESAEAAAGPEEAPSEGTETTGEGERAESGEPPAPVEAGDTERSDEKQVRESVAQVSVEEAAAVGDGETEGELGLEGVPDKAGPEIATEVTGGGEVEEAGEVEPSLESEDGVLAFWREEAESLTPVELQTVIADRYEIVEVLDVHDKEILYVAHDLHRCWQCGFEGNAVEDTFCARCGVVLERRAEVRILEVEGAEAEPSSGASVADRLVHQGRTFLVLGEPQAEQEAKTPAKPETLRFLFGQCSDPGQVRDLNEDSLLALVLTPTYESRTGPLQGLFAVADGMGGHEGGEVASKIALQILADRVLRTILLPGLGGQMVLEEEIAVRLRQAIMAANDTVYLARQKAANDMGTTLTVAFVQDKHLFLAHVGDCRVYRWNADGLEQLTTDHSVVASMVASGQATPEDVYTHPHRSIIYRCIGDKPMVEVDADQLPLATGDRLILCSDGLWEMLRSEGIEDVMLQEADPQIACELLVSRANAAGGEDNISVIVIQLDAV